MKQDVKEFIEHHGTKGMKWGVRKPRGDRSSFKKRKTGRTVYGKEAKKLTSSELEKRIKRMETEKRYNDLNKRDVSKGEQIAAEVLTNSGKKIASTVITGAALYGVKLAVQAKFGESAASMVTKRGK